MAVNAVILSDKNFETVVKVTTTGTNSAILILLMHLILKVRLQIQD